MRICIFNSFNFHFDLFGVVLEYLYTRGKYDIDVFTCVDDSLGWLDVYEKILGKPLRQRPINEYDHTQWDYVFLITDDDRGYKQEWTHAKIIFIEHSAHRRVNHPAAHFYIQPRRYYVRVPPSPENTWCMPIWDYKCGPKQKNVRTKLVCLGNNMPMRPYELIDMLPNFYDLDIVYINRSLSYLIYNNVVWKDYENIKVYEDMDAKDLITQVHSADWLLLFPLNPNHQHYQVSSMVMLSYSIGTPVLMTKEWAESYGFKGIGIMSYDTDICPPSSELLTAFEVQRQEFFQRRDRVFAAAIPSL